MAVMELAASMRARVVGYRRASSVSLRLVLAVLLLVPEAGRSQATPDSVVRWIIGHDRIPVGESVDAWLQYRGDPRPSAQSTPRDSATLTLTAPRGASAWWRAANADCGDTTRRTSLSVAAVRDTVFAVCVHGARAGTIRLLAHYLVPANPQPAARGAPPRRVIRGAAPSPAVTIEPARTLTQTETAILGGLGGLLLAVLGHVAKTEWDRRREGSRSIRKMQADVYQVLVRPHLANRAKLAEFLDGGTNPKPLSAAGYNAILRDTGLLGYLTQKERDKYFRRIAGIHKQVIAFNDLIQTDASTEDKRMALRSRQRDAALALQELLDGETAAASPEKPTAGA